MSGAGAFIRAFAAEMKSLEREAARADLKALHGWGYAPSEAYVDRAVLAIRRHQSEPERYPNPCTP